MVDDVDGVDGARVECGEMGRGTVDDVDVVPVPVECGEMGQGIAGVSNVGLEVSVCCSVDCTAFRSTVDQKWTNNRCISIQTVACHVRASTGLIVLTPVCLCACGD